MCTGLSSREKQSAFELGWGAFRKLPLPSLLTPHLLAMAPPTRTPSGWHPRRPHPSSLGILPTTLYNLLSYLITYARALAYGWFPLPSQSTIPGAFPGPNSYLNTRV